VKTYPTIGVCGLDCGLCPRFYTVGPSRCPGCGGPGFSDKHPSCSFITCCVKKRGLEVCGQCEEFPCSKFKSEAEYRQAPLSSSYPPERNTLSNLRFIREKGIDAFIRQQEKRIALLEVMIERYDDGRSRSFFCQAAALLDPEVLRNSVNKVKKGMGAKALRQILAEAALSEGIQLTGKQ
jgi:hypothetical protein